MQIGQRARDRQPLALAAGQRRAAFAEDRVVALRQKFDERFSASGACGISSRLFGIRAGLGPSDGWIPVCGAVDPAACAAFRTAVAVAGPRAPER